MQAILIISFIFLLVYALMILYYRQSWVSIPDFTTQPVKPITKISIIIPARNESQNIKACLDSITRQLYPKELFELVVVDDHSTDDTAAIVSNYAAQNVRLISLKDFVNPGGINSYKKKAIEIAIQQSSGQLIVTTDADCIVPKNWLQTIDTFYQQTNASFIAMPVAFLPALAEEGLGVRFIKIFQSLDFMTLQGITGASVHKHLHSMCNGANLAYTRIAFDAVNGFKGIDNIASGDDMLLMHKIYKLDPAKVFFLKSKDAIVQTQPMHNIKSFFNQRIRWASKADKYDDKRIFPVLLMVYLFNVLLLALPLIALFNHAIFYFQIYTVSIAASVVACWLLLIAGKTIIELLFLFPVARFFKQAKLLWLFPVMQPFHIIYTVIAGWLGKFGSYHWKDRNVK